MSLRHCILGLLSIQPMSGYDLKKVIDSSVGHFWPADQAQVYRTLAGLVADGLATRHTLEQEDRPNQHVHSVTERGLTELDRWLATPLRPGPSREPFLAQVFFADRLTAPQIRSMLARRREAMLEQLAALRAIPVPPDTASLGAQLRMATLANGIAHVRAELDWLDATEQQLDRSTA